VTFERFCQVRRGGSGFPQSGQVCVWLMAGPSAVDEVTTAFVYHILDWPLVASHQLLWPIV